MGVFLQSLFDFENIVQKNLIFVPLKSRVGNGKMGL